MIRINVEHLTFGTLKEDIGHFRNVVQHTNMNLLENVLKSLRNAADDILIKVE